MNKSYNKLSLASSFVLIVSVISSLLLTIFQDELYHYYFFQYYSNLLNALYIAPLLLFLIGVVISVSALDKIRETKEKGKFLVYALIVINIVYAVSVSLYGFYQFSKMPL